MTTTARALAVMSLVHASCAGAAAGSVPAADAGSTSADWNCPMFPPGESAYRAITPGLVLTVSEANERMAELEKYIWFDTPAGIERPEFATWGSKTKIEEVRCLRRSGSGFKSIYAEDKKLFSIPAESFASIGGSTFRFETPVLIRTGKRVVLSFATASPDYSRQHAHVGGAPGGPGHYAVTRGRAYMTIDVASIVGDDPNNYRYLVDKDEDRWVEDSGDATFVILPTRGRSLDPSRRGYAVTILDEPPFLAVRTINLVAG